MLKRRDLVEMSLTYEACKLYVSDLPFNRIKRRLGLNQQQLKRHIQKGLKWFLENYEESTDQKGSKSDNTPNAAPLQEKPQNRLSH